MSSPVEVFLLHRLSQSVQIDSGNENVHTGQALLYVTLINSRLSKFLSPTFVYIHMYIRFLYQYIGFHLVLFLLFIFRIVNRHTANKYNSWSFHLNIIAVTYDLNKINKR